MRHSGDGRLHGRGPMRGAKGIVAVMPRQQSFLILKNTVASGSLKANRKPDRTSS
jgi:hypothetical protein